MTVGRCLLSVAVLSLTGCSCVETIPLDLTRTQSHVTPETTWRLAHLNGEAVVYASLGEGDFRVVRRSDFRRFFDSEGEVVWRSEIASISGCELLADKDEALLTTGEGEQRDRTVIYSAAGRTELMKCGQGPSRLFFGAASRPSYFVAGRGCDEPCKDTSGRTVAWIDVIDGRTRRACGDGPTVPRVLFAEDDRPIFFVKDVHTVFVGRVGADRIDRENERIVPVEVEEIFGLFPGELRALVQVGAGPASQLFEFDLRGDGTLLPSRLVVPSGFQLQSISVSRGGALYAFGFLFQEPVSILAAFDAEGTRWSEKLSLKGPTRMIATDDGAVLVTLESVSGKSDVWVQRFPL